LRTVLVVDDLPALTEQYSYDLKRIAGFDVLTAGGGREALDILDNEAVDCVILDLEMPGLDGFDVLRELARREVAVPVIVYTGTGSTERCVEAMRLGAHGFIDKTEPMERVVREIEGALERDRLTVRVRKLEKRLGLDSPLIGDSPAMDELRSAMARVAAIPSPVLILGESGTGKELVSRELHRLSDRRAAPFVALNCAALPETLVESELFGHERGAFTGAERVRKGAFESAGRGTLLLDEIGDLPAPAQAKLLRVLEERKLVRVGGAREIAVEARVLAATHRDLEALIESGGFRRDLFYRLNVHVLRVPPLRERRGDVPLLVEHFLETICERFGRRPMTPAPDTLAALEAYDWRRNNVRELRNIVERMIIAADGAEIRPGDVPPEIRSAASAPGARDDVLSFRELKARAEREILLTALERNGWRIGRTASELGLADHSSLLKIMRRHGLKRAGAGPGAAD
jgi:two-component system nitrogen regulation response regulator NtrX